MRVPRQEHDDQGRLEDQAEDDRHQADELQVVIELDAHVEQRDSVDLDREGGGHESRQASGQDHEVE